MQLEIINMVSEIQKLETFIQTICGQWNIGKEEQQKINLAMEEIVSNIINYGYKDEKEHPIKIPAHFSNKAVSLRIEDDAQAFKPLEHKQDIDLNKSAAERNPGGLGIFFVKKMMDRLEYRYEGKHNILIIEKMIHNNKTKN
jgi:anti-sigma regulatory factor (Ser/Thr protein kinase)